MEEEVGKIARNLLGKKAIIEPWEKEEEGAKKKNNKKKGHMVERGTTY